MSNWRGSYTGFRRDAHPMAVMVGVVGALSAFYHDAMDISDASHRELSAFRLVAKLPTITAMTYKYNIGQPFIYPRNNLSYAENFMHMMFATPAGGIQTKSGTGARTGSHSDPACGPRAECLHFHRTPRRFQRRKSIRLHFRRYRLSMGARAWRGKRSLSEHAGGNWR